LVSIVVYTCARSTRIGLVLHLVAGVGMLGSAYFHCEAGCVNSIREPNFRTRMHMLFAFLAGPSFAISPISFYFDLKNVARWASYRGITLAATVLANIPGIIFWITMFTTRLSEWEDLIQRLGLLFPLLWVEEMAVHLLGLSK